MTIKQIWEQFDSEWVLLADPTVNAQGTVIAGKVVSHSVDRDENYRRAIELRLNCAATLYAGRRPADAIIVL